MGQGTVISGLDSERKTIGRRCLIAALLATSALLVLPAPPVAAASLPIVTTGGASAGHASWLRILEGTVVPGDFKLTECRFDYGPTTAYGASMPCNKSLAEIGKGPTPIQVSAETEPLDPKTTYHYRLVATNGIGTVAGVDKTFETGASVPEGGCGNEKIREEQGIAALLLPDCMALEMVSPAEKKGQPARRPNVSTDGSRVSFVSGAALGEAPTGAANLVGATYVASRGGGGWSSETAIPDENFQTLWESASQLRPSFTPNFSRWFGLGATALQVQQGVGRVYEAGLGGLFAPLSGPLAPLSFSSSFNAPEVVSAANFRGASADHTYLYFQSGAKATYLPNDPNPIGPGAEQANTYLASRSPGGQLSLELLQRDGEEKVWGGNCGARVGGIGSVASNGLPAPNGMRNQGAISADGARTFFSARAAQPEEGACEAQNKLRILERLETPFGPTIAPLFASECNRPVSEPCSEADGDDLFQGASLDQTKVYFTTNRQLADSDLDGSGEECDVLEAVAGCDLYLYDATRPAGNRLVQVSAGEDVPGHETGKEAKVYNGITAISADGSHAYFVAEGALTDENSEGAEAQPGEPNLYLWDAESESLSLVGSLAAPLGPDNGDAISGDFGKGLWGGQGTWRNNAYPVPILSSAEQDGERGTEGGDGHILVFESKAELLAEDGDGRRLDVYRYDSGAEPQTLECLSCAHGSSAANPDEEPFDVDDGGAGGPGRGDPDPLGTDFAESRRWVSEDGETAGFMSPQPLVPGDLNSAKDSYLWHQGELTRLPGLPPQAVGVNEGLPGPYLSHDGSTVAFATFTPLLSQDGDLVADVYVARVGGGFRPPPPPNICQGEECRPPPPPAPQLSGAGTAVFKAPVRPKPCPKGKVRRRGRCVKKRHHKKHHHRRHRANNDRRAGR